MTEQQQKFGFGRGRGQFRCTGRVGRGIQMESGPSRGHGASRQYFERNGRRGGNERNGERRGDRNASARDDNYRQQWPKSGIKPENRASHESEIELLRKQIEQMNIDSKVEFAAKLSPGENGRSVSLLTNYFTFKISQPVTIHHYSVVINPFTAGADDDTFASHSTILGAKYRRLIVEQTINGNQNVFNGNIAFYDSQRSLYSKVKYNFENESNFDATNKCIAFKVAAKEFPDENDSTFLVKLSYIDSFEVDMNSNTYSESVVNFIDLLLRYGPSKKNMVVGNTVFTSQRRYSLSVGKELAIGFSMKVHNCECGLLLNVDRALSVFYTSRSVINFFRDRIQGFDKMKDVPADKVQEVGDELRGLRVKVSLPNEVTKLVRISGITKNEASKLKCNYEIKAKDGTLFTTDSLTVDDYFKNNSQPLSHPYYPCLISGNECYPLEVCELLGDQKVNNDDDLRSDQVNKLSEVKSYKRFNEINNTIKVIQKDGEFYNKEFGVSICPDNVQVTGRVLEPPSLLVANGLPMTPDAHRCWNIQRPNTVYEGVEVKKWILVYISKDRWKMLDDEFNAQFARKLIEVSDVIGIKMDQPARIFTHDFVDVDKLKKDVFEQIPDLQLIVLLIARKDNVYNLLKKLAVYDYGVPTQCVSADNYSSSEKDNKLLHFFYLRNLSLQINAKLNGVNWILQTPSMKQTMVIGIDVKLVTRSLSFSPSIVSCIGTVDENFVRHSKFIGIQDVKHKVVDVKAAIMKLLQSYRENNNCFPESVIVYRKGAFDVSFPDVLTTEVASVKDAFLEIGCEAKASYVYIQRNIDFRLLPLNPDDATSSLTLPPGVVVDTVVTSPALHTFFLCSNIDYKGIASPPCYSLLFDENNFTADQIQQITHDMCFIHPFSSRAAALPVSVELAKQFLDRARERLFESLDTKSSFSAISADEYKEYSQRMTEALVVHEKIDKYLYFI